MTASEIAEFADRRSRRHVYDVEAKRLIDAFDNYGISESTMNALASPLFLVELMDSDYAVAQGIEPPDFIPNKIWDRADDWCRRGNVIVLDGGDDDSRQKAMHLIIMRAIITKAPTSGIDAKICPMPIIIPRFNDYGQAKYDFLNDICEYSTLVISEIDSAHRFRDNGDGKELFDFMLSQRRQKGNVTIFVLNSPSEDFKSANLLGIQFEKIIKSAHSEDRKIWRIRLQGGRS